MNENFFEIGKIVNTHGIKGELRVYPLTDDPSRFEWLDEVSIFFGEKTGTAFPLESARQHKSLVIIKLTGVDTRTAAEKMVGGIIKIPPEQALPLGDDEYFQRDLLGLAVVTPSGQPVGTLARILETGANDVYVIQPPEDGTGPSGNKEVLIPAIKDCIKTVDLAEGKMVVHLMDGLL